MRKVLVTVLSCALGVGAKAQLFGFGFGYNLNFLTPDSINFVIDRYNQTRSYLDTEMKPLTLFKGPAFSIQGSAGEGKVGLLFDLGRNWSRARTFAEGIDSSATLQHRDLRLKMDTWQFGFGVSLGSGHIVVSPGVTIEVGTLKAQTRVGPAATVNKEAWTTPMKSFNAYSALFCQILVGPDGLYRFAIQPYYRFALNAIDFWSLNEAINPNTWASDPYPITQKFGHAGLKLMLMLMLSS